MYKHKDTLTVLRMILVFHHLCTRSLIFLSMQVFIKTETLKYQMIYSMILHDVFWLFAEVCRGIILVW